MDTFRRWLLRLLLTLWVLLSGPVLVLIFGPLNLQGEEIATSNRRSVGIAPDPKTTSEAFIQLYAARSWNWRGAFFVHTWFATKRLSTTYYKVYQVIGWQYFQNQQVLVVEKDIPDRYLFGQRPQLLLDLRGGKEVDKLIDQLEEIVKGYPYHSTYNSWPGPNSNTFTAFVLRQMPILGVELPPTAIGKDFLPHGKMMAHSPSGTGIQFSFYGVFGITIGLKEGFEINLCTLNFGIDPLGLALKWPGIGRIGWK